MEIHFNEITYTVTPYGKRKGEKVLLDNKFKNKTERHVCIGNTLEVLKNPKYNSNLHARLLDGYTKALGCEIKIIGVTPISTHGLTNKRFED
jgi:hypothetical protein